MIFDDTKATVLIHIAGSDALQSSLDDVVLLNNKTWKYARELNTGDVIHNRGLVHKVDVIREPRVQAFYRMGDMECGQTFEAGQVVILTSHTWVRARDLEVNCSLLGFGRVTRIVRLP